MKKLVVNVALSASLCVCSMPLFANSFVEEKVHTNESASKQDNLVYPASFFDQYSPQTAMAMVNRLPGFAFDSGSDGRGFGGNAGNVLIDGVRPTSKSGGLKGALERIPAAQVLHIEIIKGGVGAGEAAGQAIVANVVKKEINTTGTWGVQFLRTVNGELQPEFKGAIATKIDNWDTLFDVEIGAEPEIRDIYIEDFDANNELTGNADEDLKELEQYFSLNGEAASDVGGGRLTINGAFSGEKWRRDSTDNAYSLNEQEIRIPEQLTQLDEHKDYSKLELGVDWVRNLADWKLRVIALSSKLDTSSDSTETETQVTGIENITEYFEDNIETEHIARLTFADISNSDFKSEFGVEIANNRLESEASSFKNNVEQALEGAESVEELRAEVFANFSYSIAPQFSIEGGLTSELSEIEVLNGDKRSQSFVFFKPRLSANYIVNADSSLTFVVEHTVEQLDFNDFASSADLSQDRQTSGNTKLEPEQVTAYSVIYDWRFSDRGSLNVEAVYEWRQDIHEQVEISPGNDGLGNAGDAHFWYVKTNLSLPLDLVLENALLDVFYTYKGSDFHDPIIDDSRRIYNYMPHYVKADFRHDVPAYDFSWGIQYKAPATKKKFYVDEIQTNAGNNRISEFFIETNRFWGVKTKLRIKDVDTALFTSTRSYYRDERIDNRSGDYTGKEVTYRERDTEIQLSISGSF